MQRKLANIRIVGTWLSVLFFAMAVLSADAADKYSSGTKTWDTTTSNWGTSPGNYTGSTWSDNDNAFLEGTAGTVTLGQSINITDLNTSIANYVIDGAYALNFSGIITNTGNGVTISCDISGSPDVYPNQGGNQNLTLAPTNGTMTLGTVYRPGDNYVRFNGTTTGNSIGDIPKGVQNAKVYFKGTGRWTVNNVYGGYIYVHDGELIVNGELTSDYRWIEVKSPGVLHWNNAAAVKGPSNGSSATERFYIYSGYIDNSSSAAITTSTWDPAQAWRGNWTFIGSAGANSDLYMGAGPVRLTTDVTLTVSNSLTTLTVGGVISDSTIGYDLTKAGAGTLKLTGGGTYLGETVVSEGTLSITQTNTLSDFSFLRIAGGAVLNLDYSGQERVLGVYTNGVEGPRGTWGSLASSADNKTALITGTGLLNVPEPVAVDGIRWWDGGTTDIGDPGNQLSDGVSGTWDTSIKNWDQGAGMAHTNWNNATNDLAFFKGTAGTVTLGEDINVGHIYIDTAGYTIQGNTLNFSAGGTITAKVNNVTISSGITGSPSLSMVRSVNETITLSPSSVSMTLGTINRLTDDYLVLGGTATGNTVASMPKVQNNAKLTKNGSGTWTFEGECYSGDPRVYAGTLICNGRLWETWQGKVRLYGGTLIVNGSVERGVSFESAATLGGTGICYCAAISVPVGSTIAPGYPTGTLTTTNDCTISGTLAIELDGTKSPGYSTLAVDGTLDVSAGTSTLDINETSPAYGDLVIATFTSLTGEFAVTNGLPANATITYGANAITLTVPNPAGTIFLFE